MEMTMEMEEKNVVDLERMMNAYGDSLLRMCSIYLNDTTLAEDAVQETFIKVYEKYHTFNQASEEKTWIMRIAINVCKNYRRTSWFKRIKMGVDLETVSEEQLETHLLEKEKQQHILKEISGLDCKYKEVLLLYYYQEMSTKEIANILHIKEGTVRVRLQRARQRLGIQLEEGKKL